MIKSARVYNSTYSEKLIKTFYKTIFFSFTKMNFCRKSLATISAWHRDRVANLKLYSILAIISSLGAIAVGAATYVSVGIPCVGKLVEPVEYFTADGFTGQRYNRQVDPCLMMTIFILPVGTLAVSVTALVAVFRNRPVLYQAVGFAMFASGFMQLITFIGALSVVIEYASMLDTVTTVLSAVTVTLNAVSLVFAFLNIKAVWYIFNAFSKQEREIFEERRRKEFESRKAKKGELAKATLQLANLFGAFATPTDTAKVS